MGSFLDSMIEMGKGNADEMKLTDANMDFLTRYKSVIDRVVSDFEQGKTTDLNAAIAHEATVNNWNDEQTKRIIEGVNTRVYVAKYREKKRESFNNRDVEFGIALFDKVKTIMTDGKTPVLPSPVGDDAEPVKIAYNMEDEGMDKVASEQKEMRDPLNAFNYKAHSFGAVSMAKPSAKREILIEKIANKVHEIASEHKKVIDGIHSKSDTIATALIKYASLGHSAQEVFSNAVQIAGMSKVAQERICHAFEMTSKALKEQRKLPVYFDTELHDVEVVAQADFSLGEHTLLKTAELFKVTDRSLPTILVGNETVINDYSAMAGLLSDVDSLCKQASEQQHTMDIINENVL